MSANNVHQLIHRGSFVLLAGILLGGCAVNAGDADDEEETVGQSEMGLTFNSLETIGSTQTDHGDATAKVKWVTCSEIGYNTSNCGGSGGTGSLVDTNFTWPYTLTYNGTSYTTAHFTVGSSGGIDSYWYHFTSYNNMSARLSHYEYQMDVFVGNSRSTYAAVEFNGDQMYNSKWHVYGWQQNTDGYWYYYDKGKNVSCSCSGWVNSNHSSTSFGSTAWHHVKMTWTSNSDTSDTVNCLTQTSSSGATETSFCPNATVGVGSTGTTQKVTIGLQADKKSGYAYSAHYKNITLYYY